MGKGIRPPHAFAAAFLLITALTAGACASPSAIWRETVSMEAGGLSGNAPGEAGGLSGNAPGETGDRSGNTPDGPAAASGILRLEDESGEEGPSQENGEEAPVTLLFGGDVYLSDHVLNAYDGAGGIDGVLDQTLQEAIGAADLFMVNQEFPFSSRGTPAPDKQYTFRLAPERISVLAGIGPDLVTLANNHALDYGADALLDTCAALDAAGIGRVGAGANLEEAGRALILEAGGLRIGFIGASRVFPVWDWAASGTRPGMLTAYDEEVLLDAVTRARGQCDYLVVYVHWGIERETMPEDYQRSLAYRCIDAGADLIVGSHPHVLQGIEYYQGKPILYSLGNFVFGSSIPETMLVRAEIGEERETHLTLIPAASAAGYTRALDGEAGTALLENVEALSFGVQIDGAGRVTPQAE